MGGLYFSLRGPGAQVGGGGYLGTEWIPTAATWSRSGECQNLGAVNSFFLQNEGWSTTTEDK